MNYIRRVESVSSIKPSAFSDQKRTLRQMEQRRRMYDGYKFDGDKKKHKKQGSSIPYAPDHDGKFDEYA